MLVNNIVSHLHNFINLINLKIGSNIIQLSNENIAKMIIESDINCIQLLIYNIHRKKCMITQKFKQSLRKERI